MKPGSPGRPVPLTETMIAFTLVIRRHIATMISNGPVFQLLHTLLEPFGFPNQQESAHPFKRLDGRPGGVSKGLHFALTWCKGLATWIGKVSWPVLQLFDRALGSRGVEPYVSGKGVIIRRLTLHWGQVHPISQLKALQPRLDERKALRIVKDFGNLLEPLWYDPIRIDIRANLQELRIITTQLTTTFEAFFVWGPHKWSQESGQANLPYWRHAVHNSQNTLLQKSWASAHEAKSPICHRCFSSMSFFLTKLTSSAKEQKQILRPLKMSISASLKRMKGFHDTTSIPHHLVLCCGSTLTLPHKSKDQWRITPRVSPRSSTIHHSLGTEQWAKVRKAHRVGAAPRFRSISQRALSTSHNCLAEIGDWR